MTNFDEISDLVAEDDQYRQEVIKEYGLDIKYGPDKPQKSDPAIYQEISRLFELPEPAAYINPRSQMRLERLVRGETIRSQVKIIRSGVGPIDGKDRLQTTKEIRQLEAVCTPFDGTSTIEALEAIERLIKIVEGDLRKEVEADRSPPSQLDNLQASLEYDPQAQQDWDAAADRWELASRISIAAQQKGLVADTHKDFHQYLDRLLVMTDEELTKVQSEVGELPDFLEEQEFVEKISMSKPIAEKEAPKHGFKRAFSDLAATVVASTIVGQMSESASQTAKISQTVTV